MRQSIHGFARRPSGEPARLTPADSGRRVARYRPLFGEVTEDWDGFIDALARPLPTCIWSRPDRIDGDDDRASAGGAGCPARTVPWLAAMPRARAAAAAGVSAGRHWWYCAGLAHAQEAVSQLPVLLLDLAARPAGAGPVRGAGRQDGADRAGARQPRHAARQRLRPERIAALQGNLDRLGVVNVSTTWHDGGNYPAAAGAFDRILVDAPCSSEGTLRRNRSLVDKIGPERSARMAGRQRALLRKAVKLCRPGGRIVYSTCTFAPEENELVVAEVLEQLDGRLRLLPASVPG
jgi:16S rRNA C967 or C1407 C5-methylase (RsmB/RsmF family)